MGPRIREDNEGKGSEIFNGTSFFLGRMREDNEGKGSEDSSTALGMRCG